MYAGSFASGWSRLIFTLMGDLSVLDVVSIKHYGAGLQESTFRFARFSAASEF
jgi:hypothetical protein